MFDISKEASIFLSEHENKKIVFTNGCFDILHSGHITYLNQAKSLGDILFVGLNSDSSVKKLKGPTRPVKNESERKLILENLKAVDFVEIFSDETPLELIKKVRPKLLVKGGDWKIEQIVGSEYVLSYGGEVKSLKFIEGKSTTSIVDKINQLKKNY